LLAAAITMLAATSLVVASIHARPNTCIFDDGAAYCRMALDKLAPLPFARRVSVPAVVSWLPAAWSLVFRFKLVALVASAGATFGTGLLTLRLVRDRAAPRVAYGAAFTSAAIVAVSPHLFRLALTTPVLADQAAIFLGLVWCLLVTARSPALRALSPLAAVVLIPTREAWLLPLVLASGIMWWSRERKLAVATVLATVAGAVFTYTRPTLTVGPWAHFSTVTQVLHDGRMTLTHPDHALWAIFFGAGFVWFLALALLPRWRQLEMPVWIVLAVACGHLIQAPLGGTDVSRYAAAALPFAVVLGVVAIVELRIDRAFYALVALAVATMVLWQPFRVPVRGVPAYFSMYYPGSASAPIAAVGIVVMGVTLVWLLRGSTHWTGGAPSRPAGGEPQFLVRRPTDA
jgi:hypothetical protein